MGAEHREKILVVDDSEMNRSILADILDGEYDIIEAENGLQAVSILQKQAVDISLVLLDIVMPEMDGFGVLEVMNQNGWIDSVPVVMISAESGSSSIDRAYGLGITDFISRPFDSLIVRHRVVNTILLYAKQKKLETMVAEQIYERERQGAMMVDILSHIVEFRNRESGFHVVHVRMLTETLLKRLVQITDKYQLTPTDVSVIGTASALHDIGKISIDEKILNKPGKLTDEEFAIMKTHSMAGAEMLNDIPLYQDEPIVRIAYEICRWHHERYDGRGYPDGLKGDEIPISAQIVALADVYDALTSERVYKPPIEHEKAVQMILNGECGTFNPLLMQCLRDVAPSLPEQLASASNEPSEHLEIANITSNISQYKELSASQRSIQLLEHERMKYSFFAAMSEEIQFEFTLSPPMVSLNSWGAEKLGLDEIIMDPMKDKGLAPYLQDGMWHDIITELKGTTPENPTITRESKLYFKGERRWFRVIARALWSGDEPPKLTGVIGKTIDIHSSREKLESLERMASHDALTELLNVGSARAQIEERLEAMPNAKYALAIVDLDYFKSANDNFGHSFGNEVLIYVADKLRQSVRSNDIAARIGGDEFYLFLEYTHDLENIIERIYKTLTAKAYNHFPISASMGVATTEMVKNADYDALFLAADQALYAVKNSGRGHYRFYDDSIRAMPPLDGTKWDPIDHTLTNEGDAEQ